MCKDNYFVAAEMRSLMPVCLRVALGVTQQLVNWNAHQAAWHEHYSQQDSLEIK